MLPFPQPAPTIREVSQGVIHVNLDQQRSSMPSKGLFQLGKMIFYNVSHGPENQIKFEVGKILEIDKENKKLKLQKVVPYKTRMHKNTVRQLYQEQKTGETTTTASFDACKGIQFELNASTQDIPSNTLKKLNGLI